MKYRVMEREIALILKKKRNIYRKTWNDAVLLLDNMWKAAPENGRLYLTDDPKSKKIGAWCAAGSGKGSWLQVDLGKNRTIGYIATQGMQSIYDREVYYHIHPRFYLLKFNQYSGN